MGKLIYEHETLYDAIIIGAGFSGIQQLHYLKNKLGMKVLLLEAADGVGGTWYFNRYPGARCDSESHSYCYYFSDDLLKKWRWSERYPAQKEILDYLNFVTDYLNLRPNITFGSTVLELCYDADEKKWRTITETQEVFKSQFVISAVGCLSATNFPDFVGTRDFKGETYHTGSWPHHEISFEGKNVGVVGTGSSGIQAIPVIAKTAANLIVFQRTPNFSVPARNKELEENFFSDFKKNIDKYRSQMLIARHGHPWLAPNTSAASTPKCKREQVLETAWKIGGLRFRESFGDTLTNHESNKIISEFIKKKILQLVANEEKAKILTNFDHPFGTKRPALDTEYYETFNKENVTLVDIREEPIEKITFGGIKTSKSDYKLNTIVFATGYDALTGSILKINIKGRNGINLADIWKNGPKTYLGLQVHGFPNLFFITGPGSPSVLTNMPQAIDQNVSWITTCIAVMNSKKMSTIEADEQAMNRWTKEVQDAVSRTLFLEANHSWYLGANIPGKPRVFIPYVGGLNKYRDVCDKSAENNYEGFTLA